MSYWFILHILRKRDVFVAWPHLGTNSSCNRYLYKQWKFWAPMFWESWTWKASPCPKKLPLMVAVVRTFAKTLQCERCSKAHVSQTLSWLIEELLLPISSNRFKQSLEEGNKPIALLKIISGQPAYSDSEQKDSHFVLQIELLVRIGMCRQCQTAAVGRHRQWKINERFRTSRFHAICSL